jgi:hypothetical protein
MPLSIDQSLNDGLQNRRMPVAEFSKVAHLEGIAGASKSYLFDAFRDQRPLPNVVAQKLWDLWQEIDQMAKSFEPFRLDLSNGISVHEWLRARRNGDIFSVVVKLNDIEVNP